MGFELEPELKEAIDCLLRDGRFDIRYVGNRKIAVNGVVINLNFRCKDVYRCMEWILDRYKYAALDGSEICLLLNRSKAFCNGQKTGLVPNFVGYGVFDERIREIYRCGHKKYAKIL